MKNLIGISFFMAGISLASTSAFAAFDCGGTPYDGRKICRLDTTPVEPASDNPGRFKCKIICRYMQTGTEEPISVLIPGFVVLPQQQLQYCANIVYSLSVVVHPKKSCPLEQIDSFEASSGGGR